MNVDNFELVMLKLFENHEKKSIGDKALYRMLRKAYTRHLYRRNVMLNKFERIIKERVHEGFEVLRE